MISVPPEIFLDEIVEDENQQRQKVKVPDFNQNNNETWWSREPLRSLDLSSNSLTTIPNEIEALNYLLVLNVNENSFFFSSFIDLDSIDFRYKTIN